VGRFYFLRYRNVMLIVDKGCTRHLLRNYFYENYAMKIVVTLLLLSVSHLSFSQSVKQIVLNERDQISGHYLAVEPNGYRPGDSIRSVLVLLSGFSQRPESIFPETKLHNVAYANNILTIGFAGGFKVYADDEVQANLSAVLKDVISRYKVKADQFVLGGFSAGGTIVLRYAELCNQYPGKYPVRPKGVFTVDSPIDVFTLWDMLDEAAKENFSEMAVAEANEAMSRMRNQFGVPRENVAKYAAVNPFSMNLESGDNEKHLKNTAVRTYHEVDIAWRLINRRQTVRHGNYYVTSELINRLLKMGNTKAEFIQSDKKGYRSNGMRHPHSWSIVDEVECIQWIKSL
jgi:pimeloyl-ACP methyl ester carboxylesterase